MFLKFSLENKCNNRCIEEQGKNKAEELDGPESSRSLPSYDPFKLKSAVAK